jgi:hypothetical protein
VRLFGWQNVRSVDFVFIDDERIYKLLKIKNPAFLNEK